MPINLIDKLKLRFGLDWRNFFAIALTVFGIFIILFAIGFLYYYYQEFFYMENQVRVKSTLAENREKRLVNILNGSPIGSEVIGYKLKRTYYCQINTIPFSTDTN